MLRSSRKLRRSARATRVATLAGAPVPAMASAQQPASPAAAPATTEAPPPGLWINGIHLSAQIEAGIMGNPSGPADGLNFGQLFTDHANQVQLNQLLLTANKPLDPKDPGLPVGLQAPVHVWLRRPLYPVPGRAEPCRSESALPVRCGRGERARAPALAHRGRHRSEGRAVPHAAWLRDDRSFDQPVLFALVHLPVRPAVQAHRRADRRRMSTPCSTSMRASTPAPTPPSVRSATTTTRSAASAGST